MMTKITSTILVIALICSSNDILLRGNKFLLQNKLENP